MQIRPNGIPLYHDPISLDPEFAITRAGSHTHSPDAALTFLHHHDHMEIGYCYEGSGVFIVDDGILPFSAGCASVIFRHELHVALSSAEHGSKWKFIHLEPSWLLGSSFPGVVRLLRADGRGFIATPNGPPGLAGTVRELIDETGRGDPVSVYAVKGLALCMMARISRALPADSDVRLPLKNGIRSITPALDFILENHAGTIYIPRLADICGMSVTSFRRVFSEAMGIPPGSYIQRLRMRLASLQLLHTGLSVLDVALSVGYESLSCFNRHFKRATGVSPREYRKGNAR